MPPAIERQVGWREWKMIFAEARLLLCWWSSIFSWASWKQSAIEYAVKVGDHDRRGVA